MEDYEKLLGRVMKFVNARYGLSYGLCRMLTHASAAGGVFIFYVYDSATGYIMQSGNHLLRSLGVSYAAVSEIFVKLLLGQKVYVAPSAIGVDKSCVFGKSLSELKLALDVAGY